jgi:hypothetical protein
MTAYVGAVSVQRGEEAPVATEAADRAETKDAEEPISDRTVRVVEGFGVAVWADFSIGEGQQGSPLCFVVIRV